MVHRRNHRGRHLRDACRNGLSFRRHHDDLRAHLDVFLEAQDAWNHQLGAVADRIDCAVFDDKALIVREDQLQRHDCSPQVLLIVQVLVHVLCIEDIMHRRHVAVFIQDSGANSAELCHVGTDTQHQAEVNAHRPDVRAGLARHPIDASMPLLIVFDELCLINGAHTQLPLHSGDHWGTLEQSTIQRVKGLLNLWSSTRDCRVEPDDGHVLFARRLLRLYQTRSTVQANQEAARYLRIQSSRVTCFLALQDTLDP
mmetsp:Transcript_98276/g.248059  ORF Transcript_98276/g.248059 Transcript_98276/m.248059 type:complete len:255 (+) Transcript_98276:523-1287(+)